MSMCQKMMHSEFYGTFYSVDTKCLAVLHLPGVS